MPYFISGIMSEIWCIFGHHSRAFPCLNNREAMSMLTFLSKYEHERAVHRPLDGASILNVISSVKGDNNDVEEKRTRFTSQSV